MLAMAETQDHSPEFTGVHVATLSGDTRFVNAALDACDGQDIDARSANDITPLHLAVENDMLPVVMTLIGRNANVENKTTEGLTPLHLALRKGNTLVGRYLIESAGADIHAIDNEGLTPLCVAAEIGLYDMAKTLLFSGAPYDVKTNAGLTALEYGKPFEKANVIGLLEKVEKLFGFAKANSTRDIVGYLASMKDFEERRAVANAKNMKENTPLSFAVHANNFLAAKMLLYSGAMVNSVSSYDRTVLHTAAFKKNHRIVELLLNHARENLPASHFKEFLNAASAPLRTTALHIASLLNSADVVELLLDYGADFNARNTELRVPSELTTSPDVREKYVKYYCVLPPAQPVQEEIQELDQDEIQEPDEDEIQEPDDDEMQEPDEDEIQEPDQDGMRQPLFHWLASQMEQMEE